MLPHEVQATMAKILFLIFATFILCFGRARAFDGSIEVPLNIEQKTIRKTNI